MELNKDFIIRREAPADFQETENLTREAFWNVYAPGCSEHFILHIYRDLPDFIPELSLVAESQGKILGHIMYSRAEIKCDSGKTLPIMIFGPLSVLPEFQGRGIGSVLVRESLKAAEKLGCGAVAITGSPEYYSRFGFCEAKKLGVFHSGMERSEPTPFFMIKELREGFLEGIIGEYSDPPGYFVSDEDVDEFDKGFEPKIKHKLPGQLG